MEDFKYKERVEGAQESIKRSRWVFLALTIVSLSFLITAWNAYGSWTREIPLTIHSWTDDTVVAHLQQHLTEEWVKSQMIDVPVLGIHIGISDAAPLGGFGILILSIWFYFSTRRENRTIAELLIDTLHEPDETRSRIFHSIASYLVFLTIAKTDDPITSLRATVRRGSAFATLRAVVKMLFFLAPFTIFVIVLCDTASIFWLGAPYRAHHQPLIKGDIPTTFWIEWGSIEVIALILAAFAALLCLRALQFTAATGNVLNEYSRLIRGAAAQE